MERSQLELTESDIENTVYAYSDMLFKLCFSLMGNKSDAEDAVSDTILRYITKSPDFNDLEHKKAWLLRTAINICKDKHRFNKRHACINLDDISEYAANEEDIGVLECVMNLPDKYKSVIHLKYIEGYKSEEIGKILGITPASVRKRLQTARGMLKAEYEREGS